MRLRTLVGTLALATAVVTISPVLMALPAPVSGATAERHHYTMNARVRPLLFWISKSNVGDAMTVRHQDGLDHAYSLLIGSDPERAPRKINRWGYIDESVKGSTATVVGLMTESSENSIEQAEGNIANTDGQRLFKVIQGSIGPDEAQSAVTSVLAPSSYSFRRVDTVLDLARRHPRDSPARSVKLPPDTRPGFLSALVDLMHMHVEQWKSAHRVDSGMPIKYVYHGTIYELRATKVQIQSAMKVGSTVCAHAIASQFEIRNSARGETTRFSMTYGTEGSFAEVPLTASFQPKWWFEVEIVLDDSTAGPALATEDHR